MRLQKLCEGSSSSVSESESIGTGASSEEGTSTAINLSNNQLSSSLTQFGQSPIKLLSLNRNSRARYGKRKLSSVNKDISKRRAVALDVPEQEVSHEKEEFEQKAQDLDILMEKVKEKISKVETTQSEKIQLLTLVPESWSRKSIMEYFHVTEYMVRTARL